MGDCLRTSKPCQYVTNANVNSAYYPSGLGKSNTGMPGWGWGKTRSSVSVRWQATLCNPTWQVTLHSSEMGVLWRAVPFKQNVDRVAGNTVWSHMADDAFRWVSRVWRVGGCFRRSKCRWKD